MKILLINSNPVVQKLIEITTRKIDCELLSLTSLSDLKLLKGTSTYHLVIIDDESIAEREKEFFALCVGIKSILLYSQYSGDTSLFSYAVKKPFLPNEFLRILLNFRQTLQDREDEIDEEVEVDGKDMLAEIDRSNEDEDFEQLLKELNIGQKLEGESNKALDRQTQEDLNFDELLDGIGEKEVKELELSKSVFDEEENKEILQEGILDLDEIQKVKDLLDQTQPANVSNNQNDLKILQAIFDRPIEEIKEALDGMDIQINITFSKKDNV